MGVTDRTAPQFVERRWPLTGVAMTASTVRHHLLRTERVGRIPLRRILLNRNYQRHKTPMGSRGRYGGGALTTYRMIEYLRECECECECRLRAGRALLNTSLASGDERVS
ncbi:Protein of unknown function [Gryllus bimaculatus]|nr:Protein of unknown function [Gryllus bimaculatus]